MRLKVGETWCAQFPLSIACGLGIWAVFAKHQLCRGGPVLPLTHISGFWRDQIYNVRTSWGKPITEHELRHPEVLLWFSIPYLEQKQDGRSKALSLCGYVPLWKRKYFEKKHKKARFFQRHCARDRATHVLWCLLDSQGSLHAIGFKLHLGLTHLDVFFLPGGGGYIKIINKP